MDDPALVRLVFDGSRLTLAREFAGLRKVELAAALGVTPAAVTQYEQGRTRPSSGVLASAALCLGFPVEFFQAGRPRISVAEETTYFRRLRSASRGLRKRLLARLELLAELLLVIDHYVQLPAVEIPSVDVADDRRGAADAARAVRDAWGLGGGPLTNVVRLLEAKGAITTRPRIDTTDVSAFSRWLTDRPVIVLGADRGDAARSRFDAAHELAHLVMHHDAAPGDMEMERNADAFAAAFLMPRETIIHELPERLSWPQYFELKRRWGVSIAALVRRSRDLEVISDHAYQRAMVQMSARGWRTNEPIPLDVTEEPTLLPRALRLIETEFGVSRDDIAHQLRLGVSGLTGLFEDLALADAA